MNQCCKNMAGEIPSSLKKPKKESLLSSNEKNKLSWQETYRAMAADREDWSDLDTMVADGLD